MVVAPHFPDNRINRTAYDELQPTNTSNPRICKHDLIRDNGENLPFSLSLSMIQQLRIKIVSKSQGRFVKRIKTFLPSFEIQRKNYSKEKENKRGKMDGRDAKGEKRIAQSARGKRCLAG